MSHGLAWCRVGSASPCSSRTQKLGRLGPAEGSLGKISVQNLPPRNCAKNSLPEAEQPETSTLAGQSNQAVEQLHIVKGFHGRSSMVVVDFPGCIAVV